MIDKKILFTFLLIVIIFSVGFFLRIDSTELHGLNETNKEFFTDDNGLPYFYEFDGYFYYRITGNYLKNGYLGDQILNNQSWDSYSTFPPGKPTKNYSPFIVWVSILFYYMAMLFNSNLSLLESSFWMPAIIAPLSGIVGFLLVRKYAGEVAGLVTGILLVTSPLYFVRSVPGFFDTDMFIILFSLLVVWFFSEAIESSKKEYILLNICFASLSLAFFSLAWNGWSYLFYIFILSGILYLVIGKIKGIQMKNFLMIFTLFSGLSLFLIYCLANVQGLISIIDRPVRFLRGLQGLSNSSWPNILSSVSELRKPTTTEFTDFLGLMNLGLGIFGLILISRVMFQTNMRKKYLPHFSWFLFILVFSWLLISFISFSSSLRFGMLVIPPLSILSGMMVGVSLKYFSKSRLEIFNTKIFKILSVMLVAMILIQPIISTYDLSYSLVPLADDDMVDAASWVNNNTSNNTVIISQWGYGYFLTLFAKRPVIVDGGSQNSHRTYWVFRSFTTSNESLSVGIMRMLSYSGDKSYLALDNYTNNTSLTVKIMNNILGVSKEEARQILLDKYNITPKFAEELLNETHPSKNPSFVVFTNDLLINKAYYIFLYGNWDFTLKNSSYIYSEGITRDDGSFRTYNNSVTLNLKNGSVYWEGKTPYCVIYPSNNTFKTEYVNKTSNFCVIFLNDYKSALVLDKKLANSVFVKLVILKRPTKYFKPIYKNKSVTVWKSTV